MLVRQNKTREKNKFPVACVATTKGGKGGIVRRKWNKCERARTYGPDVVREQVVALLLLWQQSPLVARCWCQVQRFKDEWSERLSCAVNARDWEGEVSLMTAGRVSQEIATVYKRGKRTWSQKTVLVFRLSFKKEIALVSFDVNEDHDASDV